MRYYLTLFLGAAAAAAIAFSVQAEATSLCPNPERPGYEVPCPEPPTPTPEVETVAAVEARAFADANTHALAYGDAYYEGDEFEASAAGAYATAHSDGCDTTGLGVQTVGAGASGSTPTETCRAMRLEQLENEFGDTLPVRLARFTHLAGYPFRLVLHIVSGGLLN